MQTIRKFPVVKSNAKSVKLNLGATHATYKNSGKPLTDLVNLRGVFLPTQDQGQYGACTAFGSLEWRLSLRAMAGLTNFIPAYFANYYEERAADGDIPDDNGSTVTEAVNVLEQWGAMNSTYFAYIPANFAVQPPNNWDPTYKSLPAQAQMIDGNSILADTLDALSNGHPVLFGAVVFSGIESDACATTGILPMPANGERSIGGHCIVAVGYNQTTQMLLILNSWGPNWGIPNDNTKVGCFWMPYAYYSKYAADCWVGFGDSVTPVTHDYKVTAVFDSTTEIDGAYDNVVISTLDGATPVPLQNVSITIKRGGQTLTPPCETGATGTTSIQFESNTEETIEVDATWKALDNSAHTATATAVWSKPAPTPTPTPTPTPVASSTLVLYFGDADLQIAADLAQNYTCPIIQAVYATPAMIAGVGKAYQVGGSSAPAGVELLAGADRFATMKAVLVAMGKD